MKLLLISPELKDSHFKFSKKEVKSFWFPRLSLTTIAGLTPPDVDIKLIDESVEDVDLNMDVDLVGISVMTFMAPRAYELADHFRSRGIKVVLGGIHPSMLPEEAKLHADAVVIGEAEEIWPRLIEDLKRGELKPLYKMEGYPKLDMMPPQRRDLLKQGAYMTTNCVQTTRGCPFDCEFCSVTIFCGNTFRLRPIEEVVKEVEGIKGDFVAFVDDNIAGNKDYAKKLFKALIPLKKKWGSQCSLTMARDPELMDLAEKSGCVAMFIGIETLSEENLASANKSINRVKEYEKQIAIFHDHGMMVNAGMIFGFDYDDESVFERTVDFLIQNRVELVLFSILTPLPGTALHARLESEGRIIDRNWAHYAGRNVVFKPRLLSPEALEEGYFWAYHKFYSIPSIARRMLHPQQRFLGRLGLNYGYRRMVLRAPKGRVSPLSRVINSLHGKFPSFERENMIPNALSNIKEKVGEVSGQIDRFLHVRARKNDDLSSLQVDLAGTMDKLNAKEIKKRILAAAERARMDIIVNFENLRYITPSGLKALIDKDLFRTIGPDVKVRCLNLKSSFKQVIDEMKFSNINIEMIE